MQAYERIIELMKYLNLNKNSFSEEIGMSSNVTIGRIINEQRTPHPSTLQKIVKRFPQINYDWLLTGEGEMLKGNDDENSIVQFYNSEFLPKEKKLIPFYDDITKTAGGIKGKAANVDDSSYPTEYIDTGDWFTEATAAIRHYGESMIEYPEGSILALKEVNERQLIVWGRDYVIETNEYRITKRVQRGKNDDYIKAYSSNTETYPDGQLIHEPLDIAWNDVRHISLVLGYVVKKNGGTMVYAKNK